VLTPTNHHGFRISDALRKRGIEPIDSLLRSSLTTRQTAGALTHILNYLADPGSARKLAQMYRVWRRDDRANDDLKAQIEAAAKSLERCTHVEEFLHPTAEQDWLRSLQAQDLPPGTIESLEAFRHVAQRWLRAIELPIDQLVLTLSQELFTQPVDLAIAHKLAVLLRRARALHPEWSLPELSGELKVIARNERRFLGFDAADSGFDPQRYRGRVVVATMHKAKGLEWDRVYLTSVNNYSFPSGVDYDTYQPEKWFLRDQLNLEAETLAQLKAALAEDPYTWYIEGEATKEARLEFVRERLRLLYVGITRARKELIITWNTGRRGKTQPALPLIALDSFLKREVQTN
jgi:DNA helicase-2/ATP-dependent DNA helicase PcrA